MTLTPWFTPSSKADMKNSVSSLALASAEVQSYTLQLSAQVKSILETPQAANDNRAPRMEESEGETMPKNPKQGPVQPWERLAA